MERGILGHSMNSAGPEGITAVHRELSLLEVGQLHRAGRGLTARVPVAGRGLGQGLGGF